MQKQTPFLALIFTAILGFSVIYFFQIPERPFTNWQKVMIYFFSFLPSIGFALLFDAKSRAAKRRYLKINFYDQNKTPEELVNEILEQERLEQQGNQN